MYQIFFHKNLKDNNIYKIIIIIIIISSSSSSNSNSSSYSAFAVINNKTNKTLFFLSY